MSQLDVIRTIYGSKLANELLEFSIDKGAGSSTTAMNLHHQVRGFVSNANYKYVHKQRSGHEVVLTGAGALLLPIQSEEEQLHLVHQQPPS
jgi:hypothetical protein